MRRVLNKTATPVPILFLVTDISLSSGMLTEAGKETFPRLEADHRHV